MCFGLKRMNTLWEASSQLEWPLFTVGSTTVPGKKTLHIQFCSVPLKRRLRFSPITINLFVVSVPFHYRRVPAVHVPVPGAARHVRPCMQGTGVKIKDKVCDLCRVPLLLSAIATLRHRYSLDHRCRLPSPLSGSSLPSAIATLCIIAAVCHRHSLDHRCRLPSPLSGSSLPSAIATVWIIAAVCHRHSLYHRCRLPSPLSGSSLPSAIATLWIITAVCHFYSLDRLCCLSSLVCYHHCRIHQSKNSSCNDLESVA